MADPFTSKNSGLNDTPPSSKPHLAVPTPSQSSFLSAASPSYSSQTGSPGILTFRQLTASPVGKLRDRDKTRRRLAEYSTLDDAVHLLSRAKSVVILSGAGISTSLDIPDFRSDDGFYNRLSSNIGITAPEEFFSVDFFKRESEVFWKHVKPLLPKHARTLTGAYKRIDCEPEDKPTASYIPKYSTTHAFLAMLQARGKLLTNYTQNIDSLEQAAGVKAEKIIQCHGSWETASCMSCHKTISAKKYLPIVYQAGYPRCKCSPLDVANKKSPRKSSKKRKRLVYEGDSDHDSDDGTKTPNGLFKPDITFFGEPIPDLYVPRLKADKLKADLIMILGTSLKVRPVKLMVTEFAPDVPQIWINRDRFSGYHSDMPGVQFDIELLGECDLVIEELCRRVGYDLQPFKWPRKANNVSTQEGLFSAPAIKCANASNPVNTERSVATKKLKTGGKSDRDQNHAVNRDEGLEAPKIEEGTSDSSKTRLGQEHISESHSEDTRHKATHSRSDIRIEADLDAEWRWRFHKKVATKK